MTDNLGPEVILQSEIQQEMTIRIPQSYSYRFAQFFEKFDETLDDLQIQSYGISISTLEEVFLRIGHLEDPSSPNDPADVKSLEAVKEGSI